MHTPEPRFTGYTWTKELPLYQFYCSLLFRHGTIVWRKNTDIVNIVVMNSYNPETGDFLVCMFLSILKLNYIFKLISLI